ncbi:MAG: alpha/beta hydrolase-fold protein [Pseudobdellovibrio sp.]
MNGIYRGMIHMCLKHLLVMGYLLSLGLFCSSCTKNKLAENITKTNSVCETVKTSVEWKYCFSPGSVPKAGKLIYYFHGGDGSETDWVDPNNYSEGLRQSWKKTKPEIPSVVSISFGKMWLLADRSSATKSGLYDVVKNEIIPFVEKNILKFPVQERILLGESMGGFNAGTFALRNLDLFSKLALICPSLGSNNKDLSHDVDGYIKETGADPKYAKNLIKIRDEYFPSWESAYAQSPLTLIKNIPSKKSYPKIFISCGDQDQYGFFKSSADFVKLATEKGFNTIWKPVSGGKHCSLDVEALSTFLIQ